MAKKQATMKDPAAAGSPAVRAANPKPPRVRAAQHKVVPADLSDSQKHMENPHEAIAKIAYGYWESRGCQGGAALEDWVRAEQEYYQRLDATRL